MTYTDDRIDKRIRSLVRHDDDSDWHGVRRRARRKLLPTALATALIIVALLAAPALAFRNQLDDLWARAEPERNLYVRAMADCGDGSFTLRMDPKEGAVVQQDGETLARATITEREIACAGPIRALKSTPDDASYSGTDQRAYAATEVTCETDVPLEIGVNPIWYHDGDTGDRRMSGSTLLVAERGTKRLFASAVLRKDPHTGRNWSALHWNSSVCFIER